MITLSPEELAGLIAKAVAQGVTAALSQVQGSAVETAKQARNRRYYEKRKAVKEGGAVGGAGVVVASDSVGFQTVSDVSQSGSGASQTVSVGAVTGAESTRPSPSSLSPTPPISPPPPALTPACTGEEAVASMQRDSAAVRGAAKDSAHAQGSPDGHAADRPGLFAEGAVVTVRPKGQVAFSPPSLELMQSFATSLDPPLPVLQVELAWNFYESKGWRVGNQKMRDWKASLRAWQRRWVMEGKEGGLTNNQTKEKQSYGSTSATHLRTSLRSDSANRPGRYG